MVQFLSYILQMPNRQKKCFRKICKISTFHVFGKAQNMCDTLITKKKKNKKVMKRCGVIFVCLEKLVNIIGGDLNGTPVFLG